MKLYTDQEKEILNNFFIEENNSSNKIFKQYRSEQLEAHKLSNQFIESIWSKETNDNLFTHFFKNTKFSFSNTKIKNMLLLKANINHQNNDGDTPLHVLVKKEFLNDRAWSAIFDFIEIEEVDFTIKDNNGNTAIELITTKDKVFNKDMEKNIANSMDNKGSSRFFTPYDRVTSLFTKIIVSAPQTIDNDFYNRWKEINEILNKVTHFYMTQPQSVTGFALGSAYLNKKLEQITEINLRVSNIGLSDKLNKYLPSKITGKSLKL